MGMRSQARRDFTDYRESPAIVLQATFNYAIAAGDEFGNFVRDLAGILYLHTRYVFMHGRVLSAKTGGKRRQDDKSCTARINEVMYNEKREKYAKPATTVGDFFVILIALHRTRFLHKALHMHNRRARVRVGERESFETTQRFGSYKDYFVSRRYRDC